MDQRSFQRLLRRTVALPVLLLMLLAAVLAGESLLLYASLHWVDHSDQVIGTARQVQRQIMEMETDLRGYYLTGDRVFLDSYNDAKSKVPDQLDSLQRLTSDNPAQQARLKVAREVDQRWLEWAARQMPGGRQSSPSAEELLKGQQLLDQTRQRQRDFVAAEESGYAPNALPGQGVERGGDWLCRRALVTGCSVAAHDYPPRTDGPVFDL